MCLMKLLGRVEPSTLTCLILDFVNKSEEVLVDRSNSQTNIDLRPNTLVDSPIGSFTCSCWVSSYVHLSDALYSGTPRYTQVPIGRHRLAIAPKALKLHLNQSHPGPSTQWAADCLRIGPFLHLQLDVEDLSNLEQH